MRSAYQPHKTPDLTTKGSDNMKNITTTIRGISPLLQHGFSAEFQRSDASRPNVVQVGDPRSEAEAVAYRDQAGNCYFPGQAISRLIREAGAGHKLKGSRRAVKFVVPAAVVVEDDHVPILDLKGKPVSTFEVDSRPVTIPATKGRIMRHRPRFDSWQAVLHLQIDEEVLPATLVHQLLEEGGRRIGIGDFRPEKGGPFGRFEVLVWE